MRMPNDWQADKPRSSMGKSNMPCLASERCPQRLDMCSLTAALPLHRHLRRLLRSILRRRPVPERLRRGVGRELCGMPNGQLQHRGRHG